MNIKTVSEKTGLTKKAIKYYESEGLICPAKNNENNYREYTDEDIVKLNLIGTLRAVDIPISEIKSLIEGNKSLKEIMNDTLNKIVETINNLEKSKLVISSILSKDLNDYYSAGEHIKKLKDTLELSINQKKEFISDTLKRIFPGNFGRIFVLNYEPFLNITIDSDEKKETWLKLVEFLDDLDEADESNPIVANIKNFDMEKVESFKEDSFNNIKMLLSGDAETKEKLINGMISFVRAINENEELKLKFKENVNYSVNMLNEIGAPGETFDVYLEILNNDYKRYREIGKEINKEASDRLKKEFGFTFEEFFKGLK